MQSRGERGGRRVVRKREGRGRERGVKEGKEGSKGDRKVQRGREGEIILNRFGAI